MLLIDYFCGSKRFDVGYLVSKYKEFGLNEKIGNISYYDSSGQQEYSFQKPFSEKTAELIDQEISKLIETAYQRAVELLTNNIDKLDSLASVLMDKEVIYREDLELIFGKRPFDKDREIESIINNDENILLTDGKPTNDYVVLKEDNI